MIIANKKHNTAGTIQKLSIPVLLNTSAKATITGKAARVSVFGLAASIHALKLFAIIFCSFIITYTMF